MQEHSFLHDFGRVLGHVKEYWHLIAAFFATLWAALALARRRMFSGFATKRELVDCHDKLVCKIEENRDQNTREHSEIKDIIIDSLRSRQ